MNLTNEQIEVLINLVNEERQFWNEEDQKDAKYHGRDEKSLNQLVKALRGMLK